MGLAPTVSAGSPTDYSGYVKRRSLRVPATLAIAMIGTGVVVASTTASCGSDDEMEPACQIYCFDEPTDGGVPPPDGGCPLCADVSSDTPVCPAGCAPLG